MLILLLHQGRYAGLGTNLIDMSQGAGEIFWYDWLLKGALTVLTLSAGFQGGEVTPLFSIGASLGAVLAFSILMPFISPMLLGCTYAAVSGIMVFISFDELLPAAHEFGEHHISILGLVSGMAVMAFSLILL